LGLIQSTIDQIRWNRIASVGQSVSQSVDRSSRAGQGKASGRAGLGTCWWENRLQQRNGVEGGRVISIYLPSLAKKSKEAKLYSTLVDNLVFLSFGRPRVFSLVTLPCPPTPAHLGCDLTLHSSLYEYFVSIGVVYFCAILFVFPPDH